MMFFTWWEETGAAVVARWVTAMVRTRGCTVG